MFALNLVLALLALISTQTSSTGYSLVLLAIGAAAVALLLDPVLAAARVVTGRYISGSASARRRPSSSVTGGRQPVAAALDRSSFSDPIRLS